MKKMILMILLLLIPVMTLFSSTSQQGQYGATFYCLPELIRSLDGVNIQPTPVPIGSFFLNPGATYNVTPYPAPMRFYLYGPSQGTYSVQANFSSTPTDGTDVTLNASWHLRYGPIAYPGYEETLPNAGNWTRNNLKLMPNTGDNCKSNAIFTIYALQVQIPSYLAAGFAANLGNKIWHVTMTVTATI